MTLFDFLRWLLDNHAFAAFVSGLLLMGIIEALVAPFRRS